MQILRDVICERSLEHHQKMRFGHVLPSLTKFLIVRLLRERMTLLPLKKKNSRVHSDGSPLDALRDLALSLLHLLAVPAKVHEVKAVVKDGFVLDGIVNLLENI